MTLAELERQVAADLLQVKQEHRDHRGNLKKVEIEATRYVESDTAVVERVLGREVGGKRNILVLNDEAHHAYRIRSEENNNDDSNGNDEEDYFVREATVWIEGLDRIHKLRGINAIESGLVKIPQLAVRDTTGAEIPGYFNIWRWILPQLTSAERGGRKTNPKPEAILKYAHMPMQMLGGLWDEKRREWNTRADEPRPPVFILVCRDTKLARVIHEWLADDKPPSGIPPAHLEALRNRPDRIVTIRVDTKVVQESDTGEAKSDEVKWMRLTLEAVGRLEWPRNRQGREIYPEGFEELAKKLDRPLHPPGRDVRCIVSVGMLTEGWDCNTVTHIIGLRPFMSQLLCEQVVGRGLRRANYDIGEDGKLSEEIATVFGVPFEVIPFKQNKSAPAPRPKRNHVQAIPEKADFEITFPRVEGYRQAIRNKVTVDWDSLASLTIDPKRIPPEVQTAAFLPGNQGRPTLTGPGALGSVDLNPFRRERRLQELTFEMATVLTRDYLGQGKADAPAHVLFPQLARIVHHYLSHKIHPEPPAQVIDAFLSPYYGWIIERLRNAIKPDTTEGEAPELPIYEKHRPAGSTADVDFWTSREVREVVHSHLNYVVADTKQWEQSASYLIDEHPNVFAFAKNAGLGFAIPYLHNGQMHDFEPDFIIRLKGDTQKHVILETKGYDDTAEIKAQAAKRWTDAVNADGRHGQWEFRMVRQVGEVIAVLNSLGATAEAAA
jgi:type III restriction enzyme